ncbi:SDR family NAD(P)-dependent oxidoreductase [Levilactobacillus bambusae]|uniref:Carbonyl reductase n=1 Tax=Levilactobacillus bambusae TaxID=2024736 RepID=A0A2V1N0X4_9LACO|nr:SDR family NAD(P)-dependent oxidoreductase [Levilactobacillus bambusae]PWG00398.1 carbonyl reductase [Levilactobacillus bambusae]
MTNTETITLITGANRGMGYELAKALGQAGQHVLVGSRRFDKGQAAVQQLQEEGITADAIQLDATDHDSITRAVQRVSDEFGYLTILINNAGAAFDSHHAPSDLPLNIIRQDFDLNLFGLIDVTQQFLPLLKKSPSAKIINISSMMGSITAALDPNSAVYRASAAGYQASKSAVNMYSVQLAKELQRDNLPITVNLIDPGMVATHFGGVTPEQAKQMGAQPLEVGIARTVELATSSDNNTSATFSNVNGPVGW